MKALTKAQTVTALRGFAAMVFTIAASPVLHAAGVSFQVISLGFGLLYSVLAISEIPTGAWADIFGSKKSAVFGGFVQALSLLILSFGPINEIYIWISFSLYGLGSSFVSGALSALLFATAQEELGSEFNSNLYFSSIEKFAVASYVFASVSVGLLSEWLGRTAFSFGAFFFFISALLVAHFVREPPPEREHRSARQEFSARIRKGLKAIRGSTQLVTLVPVRILHQVETILGVLWLPWIQKLGGGNAAWISVLATGSYLMRYAINHYFANKPRPQSYFPRLVYALTIMAIGSLICVWAESIWIALFGIWTMAGARGAFLPAIQAIQHENLSEKIRATGLSVINFTTEAVFALSYFASAVIIDKIPVSTAWFLSSVCFLLSAVLCLKAAIKIRNCLDPIHQ